MSQTQHIFLSGNESVKRSKLSVNIYGPEKVVAYLLEGGRIFFVDVVVEDVGNSVI